MALIPCNPFSYDTYRNHINDFIPFVVNHIKDNLIRHYVGWANQLESYRYNSPTGVVHFQEGINTRHNFHNRLVEAIPYGIQQIQPIVDEIMTWGGMKKYPVTNELLQSFHILDALAMGNHTNWQNLIGKRIASTSKIYEMYNPNCWSIYDSRVGNGLQFLVSLYGEN